MGLVLDGLIAMFIGGPVTEAALYASACHPRSEALVVVVASVVALSVRCTTKLTGPHDQSVLQHVALLEVGEQSRDRLIRSHRVVAQCLFEVAMLIPAAVSDFDKTHSGFGKSAGEQALTTELGGGLIVETVEVFSCLRLRTDVKQLGNLRLHSESQFKRLDDAVDLGIVNLFFEFSLVE